MSYNPHGRNFYAAKAKGIEVVSSLSYLKRRGIVFQWDKALFNGNVFGTHVGPLNCLFTGGFHDLAHALDFHMMGRKQNVHRYGMSFNRPWADTVEIGGRYYDDMPRSSQITNCEIRTFALQAFLIEREAGEILTSIDYSEEEIARAAGYLSEFPPMNAGDDSFVFGRREYAIVHSMNIEDYAEDQATLTISPGFPDEHVFTREVLGLSERRFNEVPYAERKDAMVAGFQSRLIDRYTELRTNPFLQRRLDRALTELTAKLRRNQRANNFTFNSDKHYGTPA